MAQHTTLERLAAQLPPEERTTWDAFQHAHDMTPRARRGRTGERGQPRQRPHLKALKQILGPELESDMPAKGNSMTFEKVREAARELGKQRGLGKDTGGKFYYSITEGAFNNAIDLTPDKHSKGVDDAGVLAEEYYKSTTGAVIYDAKADNQRKLTSCVRTCIKLGTKTGLGKGEPMNTVDDFISIRRKLRSNPANAKKLDDFSNSFLKMARAQIKADTPLSSDVLTQLCYKGEKEEKTLADVWAGVRKTMTKLAKGKGGMSDDDPRVKDIIDTCTERLRDLVAPNGDEDGDVTDPVTDDTPTQSADAMKAKFAAMEDADEADVKEASA